jgi:hypothetical protein
VQLEAEQTAIPEVVHVGAQIGEDCRGRVRQVVEHLDQAALLSHEHAAIACELDGRWLLKACDYRTLPESWLQCLTRRSEGIYTRRNHHYYERAAADPMHKLSG